MLEWSFYSSYLGVSVPLVRFFNLKNLSDQENIRLERRTAIFYVWHASGSLPRMNPLILIIILLFLFGGGGFYFGGPAVGGGGVGLIVLIAILIYFFGSGRSRP